MVHMNNEHTEAAQEQNDVRMEQIVDSLSAQEVTAVLHALGSPEQGPWNPETAALKDMSEKLTLSIAAADQGWKDFLNDMNNKKFPSAISCGKAWTKALQWFIDSRQQAATLKDDTRALLNRHTIALNNQSYILKKQYNELKYKLRSGQPPTAQMMKLQGQYEELDALKDTYETMQQTINDQLSTFTNLLENKKDQHKVILYGKTYNKSRLFNSDLEDKAKTKAKNGTHRDPDNASQYLWGGTKHEKGKCNITDAQRAIDKETLKTAKSKRDKGESRSWIEERTTESDQTVPAVLPDIDGLMSQFTLLTGKVPQLKKTLAELN